MNVTCTLANTEYNYALPDDVKKIKLQVRGLSELKLSDTSGASGTTYFTVGAGSTYEDELIKTSGVTLYFQTTQAAQVVEIIYWI